MKIVRSLVVALVLRQALAGVTRKPPAFSTPVYSNSYLPAAMQVIFHAVEQLKVLQVEEASQAQTVAESSTATTPPMKKQQQSLSTTSEEISMMTTAKVHADKRTETPQLSSSPMNEILNQGSTETYYDLTEAAQHVETSTVSIVFNSDNHEEESPEVNEETVETNYESPATPETNYELPPEAVQEMREFNRELPEESEEKKFSMVVNSSVNSFSEASIVETSQYDIVSQQSIRTELDKELDNEQRKKKPTIDSVVDEIYGIVKTTSSPFIEDSSDMSDESKSATELSIEKTENIEDEEDETRFTLLGEKVAQVPRPSLNSYLRRTKVPSRPSLRQLASLYDALSKDARKQGFARFAGYSDEILKTLESSAEGGVGPQLKQLLEKVVERNELTRDDAKMKTSQALRDLDDPASALNMDLRRLLPLRFTA